MRRLIKNRKGTAEVIGTIMFIMILLFFFTGVYLWHDAATKDANGLYLKKINSTFAIKQTGPATIQVSASGSDIVLSRLWIVDTSGRHMYTDLGSMPVAAGATTSLIDISTYKYAYTDIGDNLHINVPYQSAVKCWVINTLGTSESCTLQS